MKSAIRLALIVSHPIQYYAPLYRRLAARDDVCIKVFFTWHSAQGLQRDKGFERELQWDIPVTEGYDYELVTNVSRSPGTHHFFGLRNPGLIARVEEWRPHAVHITGYPYASHLNAIRYFCSRGIPVLFRGDSHLLDQKPGWRWTVKRSILSRLYQRTTACLYVGKNNYEYYRALGVPESRLFHCPHSIEVGRFAEPNDAFEREAATWRERLRIPASARVLLFAGKFESKKQPVEFMKVASELAIPDLIIIMVGDGKLRGEVERLAASQPEKFRIVPFQNQSKMPVVYRLGDVFVLPSAYDETWGLAVNEALASGRRVLVSPKVGCGPDVVSDPKIGETFDRLETKSLETKLGRLFALRCDREYVIGQARRFDVAVTEETLCLALNQIVHSAI